MSDNSAIEWTDATWNPVTGCTKVSPGCDNCYAETFAERFRGTPGHYFSRGFDVQVRADKVNLPLTWRKPKRVFVNSMSDLLHADVDQAWVADVFAVMAAAGRHTFQVLTKRHARMRTLLSDAQWVEQVRSRAVGKGLPADAWQWPLPNVWLGVSVEDQKRADLRIPALLDTPAAVRFLSCEPLLGPVDLCGPVVPGRGRPRLTYWLDGRPGWGPDQTTKTGLVVQDLTVGPRIDWVIVGGESGTGARPMDPQWARTLRDQCQAAGVPYFFKQWGAWVPTGKVGLGGTLPGEIRIGEPVNEYGFRVEMRRTAKKAAGRELDGRTWDEFPEPVPA